MSKDVITFVIMYSLSGSHFKTIVDKKAIKKPAKCDLAGFCLSRISRVNYKLAAIVQVKLNRMYRDIDTLYFFLLQCNIGF